MLTFVKIAKEVFEFLEKEYGYFLEASSEEKWGGQLLYLNQNLNVGIRLVYEIRDAYVFVFVYKLVAGQPVDNPRNICDETEISCFELGDLLDEERKVRPAYAYGENSSYYDKQEGLRNFVLEFATRLRHDGRDVLTGDFSRLSQAENAIKTRAKNYRKTSDA